MKVGRYVWPHPVSAPGCEDVWASSIMLLCFVLKVEIKEQIKEQIMVRLNLYTGISENIARSLDLHMFYSFPCSSFQKKWGEKICVFGKILY